MSLNSRVIWSEGMFIRPQHFQQQDRYLQHLLTENNRLLQNYAYGVTDLKLDADLLAMGRVAVLKAKGIFPDGTYFNVAEDSSFVEILEVPEKTKNALVYLALPLSHPSVTEVALNEEKLGLARFTAQEFEAVDNTSDANETAPINVGKMQLRLLLDSDDLSQFACLPIAKIVEVSSDKKVVLDSEFLPTVLDCKTSAKLKGFLVELHTLLQQRRHMLNDRMGDINRSNNLSAVSDLLLLQLAGRYEAIFKHMLSLSLVHPESFYAELLKLASELNVFVKKQQLDVPEYNHEDLQQTFEPMMIHIRRALSLILKHAAELLPIEQQDSGINVATIYNRSLLDECTFIVKVKADIETAELVKRFPAQVKVGPVEEIKQLIRLQLAGLKLKLLPVVPAQLPYQAGCSYFAIEAKGDLWDKLRKSAGFAFHISGDFPGLQIELWAVRGE